MIVAYLLLFIAGITVIYAIKNSRELLALMDIIDEAKESGIVPDNAIVKKSEKVLAVLCYLLAATIILFTLFSILQKYSHG